MQYKIEFPGSNKNWTSDFDIIRSYADKLKRDCLALFHKAKILIKSDTTEEVKSLSDFLTTDVMFRVDNTKDFKGQVIALFPHDVETLSGNVGMYAHVGQHSSADYYTVIRTSRPATPEEYKDLKAELEGNPYNYYFKIVRCQNKDKFREELKKIRNTYK